MTWDDYEPVPGYDWTDPEHQPLKKIRAALVLGDFEGREFVVEEKGLTDDPADSHEGFLVIEPSELNGFHTSIEQLPALRGLAATTAPFAWAGPLTDDGGLPGSPGKRWRDVVTDVDVRVDGDEVVATARTTALPAALLRTRLDRASGAAR